MNNPECICYLCEFERQTEVNLKLVIDKRAREFFRITCERQMNTEMALEDMHSIIAAINVSGRPQRKLDD